MILILYQLVDFARCLALQHLHLEVLASNDALASENLLHCLARQLRMIVLLAEMAEPYIAQVWRGIIGKRIATVVIAQMAIRSQYSILEILG